MKDKIIKIVKLLLSKDIKNNKKDYIGKSIVSLVFFFVAFIMLMINIKTNQELMSYCSVGLMIGFLVSFIASFIFKKSYLSGLIIDLLTAIILSIFAVSGGNDGFAILWILLIPTVSVNLIGISNGFMISTYFLLFLFILFYSPLNSVIDGKYSTLFISRFPILYLADYLVSLFLSLQKEYYYKIINKKSYLDDLTGVYNRRYFLEKIEEKTDNNENIGIMIIDVNGLKTINDSKGHKYGDELIKAVPICFKKVFGNIDMCRIGGDEFSIIISGNDEEIIEKIEKVKEEAKNFKNDFIDGLSFSIGYASSSKFETNDLNELFIKADELMYQDKSDFYSNSKNERRKR